MGVATRRLRAIWGRFLSILSGWTRPFVSCLGAVPLSILADGIGPLVPQAPQSFYWFAITNHHRNLGLFSNFLYFRLSIEYHSADEWRDIHTRCTCFGFYWHIQLLSIQTLGPQQAAAFSLNNFYIKKWDSNCHTTNVLNHLQKSYSSVRIQWHSWATHMFLCFA